MTDNHRTFAFCLARRADGAGTATPWRARKGPSVAGCTGVPFGDYRTGDIFNPDSGFLC